MPALTALRQLGPSFSVLLCIVYLNRNNVICTGSFLALAYLEFNRLAVIQRCVVIATFDFRMMYKKIFAAVFRRNEIYGNLFSFS
jgi:hypothetical protein